MITRRQIISKIFMLSGGIAIGAIGAKDLVASLTPIPKEESLHFINRRRTVTAIEHDLTDILNSFIGEPLDPITMKRVDTMIKTLVESYKNKGLIEDFRAWCDETINTPDTIDRNELHTNILLKFKLEAEYINIHMSIEPNSYYQLTDG